MDFSEFGHLGGQLGGLLITEKKLVGSLTYSTVEFLKAQLSASTYVSKFLKCSGTLRKTSNKYNIPAEILRTVNVLEITEWLSQPFCVYARTLPTRKRSN